jgi:hypothetical protein
MSDLGISIENVIKDTVDRVLSKGNMVDTNYIATDNLGEIVEKLVILHIRTWMLEDQLPLAKDDAEVGIIKNKIDICFKIKRPKFVQAINLLVEDAIRNNKSLKEDSVKLYKGFANE